MSKLVKWFKLASCVLLLAGFSNCSATSPLTPDTQAVQKTLITACNGFATAEKGITIFIQAGVIKSTMFPQIDTVRAPVVAFCDPNKPLPQDPLSIIQQVIDATSKLSEISSTAAVKGSK